jgi:murein DD-endopeptidase MepM/ murein hydrolase activator NlpD
VQRGQHIADVGGTGEWPEVHLHFQVSTTPPTDIMGRTIPVRFVNAPPADGVAHSREPGYWIRAQPVAP